FGGPAVPAVVQRIASLGEGPSHRLHPVQPLGHGGTGRGESPGIPPSNLRNRVRHDQPLSRVLVPRCVSVTLSDAPYDGSVPLLSDRSRRPRPRRRDASGLYRGGVRLTSTPGRSHG